MDPPMDLPMANESAASCDLHKEPSRHSPVEKLREAVKQSRQESCSTSEYDLYDEDVWETSDVEMRSPSQGSHDSLSSVSHSSRPVTAPGLQQFWNKVYAEGACGEGSPPLVPVPTEEEVVPQNFVRTINSPKPIHLFQRDTNRASSFTTIPRHQPQNKDGHSQNNLFPANLDIDIDTIWKIKNKEELERLVKSKIVKETSSVCLKPGGLAFTIPANKSSFDHVAATPAIIPESPVADKMPEFKRKGYSILPDIHSTPNSQNNKIRSQRARAEDARRLAEEREAAESPLCGGNMNRRRRHAAEKARRRNDVESSLMTDVSESRSGNRLEKAEKLARLQRAQERRVKRLEKDLGIISRPEKEGRKSRRDKT